MFYFFLIPHSVLTHSRHLTAELLSSDNSGQACPPEWKQFFLDQMFFFHSSSVVCVSVLAYTGKYEAC